MPSPKKAPRGRTPELLATPRTHTMGVRVSDDEMVQIERVSSHEGLAPSVWARSAILRALRKADR